MAIDGDKEPVSLLFGGFSDYEKECRSGVLRAQVKRLLNDIPKGFYSKA